MSIKQNLDVVEKKLSAFQNVKVIAVSKKQAESRVREAYAAGVVNFAENYLQEAEQKLAALSDLNLTWHFIGSLQSKKIKDIVGKFVCIHSVDRMKVMREIDKQAGELKLKQKVLVQVNLAEEASKSGLAQAEISEFFAECEGLVNVEICGLMVMPPFVDNPEENRQYFREARALLEKLRSEFGYLSEQSFKELSMGTSQDYLVAAEEGATMVRLGTVLLGERNYD